jgi:hypothetical protein
MSSPKKFPWLPLSEISREFLPVEPEPTFWSPNQWERIKENKRRSERFARRHVLPKLVPILTELGAQWRFMNCGFHFLFPSDAFLSWWPQTGVICWLGATYGMATTLVTGEPIFEVLQRYQRCLSTTEETMEKRRKGKEKAEVTAVQNPEGPSPVCLICALPKQPRTCSVCSQDSNFCPDCWDAYHWCEAEEVVG